MLFNSAIFLLWFLPVVLFFYYLSKPKNRQTILLGASYIFYAWWNPVFCILMLISTSVDYYAGKKIASSLTNRWRIFFLCVSLVINLGLLAFFKYYVMFYGTVVDIFGSSPFPAWKIILPIGISFYTFQSVSYSIDIYRRDAKLAKNFIDFACYVSLFPQLIAGPIVRYHEISEQLHKRSHTIDKVAEGIYRFILGLSKKVLLADTFSVIADTAFNASELSTPMAWVGILAYTLQIYFDFSGYSDMAIGLGLLFGFRFPENFNRPYMSRSITEFWQRWHMTLGNWFRDYLYIPLGGSRKGKSKTLRNLMITMSLAGLWHGAAWTFVGWGIYYGVLLVIERLTLNIRKKLPIAVQVVSTFLLVVIGWVMFRASSFTQAMSYYKSLLGGGEGVLEDWLPACLVIGGLIFILFEFKIPKIPKRYSLLLTFTYCLLLITDLIVITGNEASPFIYFQF